MTGRIVPPIVAMVAATVVFTAVFFYTTPRTGGANWQRGLGRRSVVGFSPEVSFEEMGRHPAERRAGDASSVSPTREPAKNIR